MRCFNWKVVAALAVAAAAIWVVAPGSVAAVVPLLLLAACPLSMLLMMRTMGSGRSCAPDRDTEISKLRDEIRELRAARNPSTEEV